MDMYASARPFFGPKKSWVIDPEDQDRILAYEVYENIYRTAPGTFALLQRGQEASPVYMPSPKKLVEAVNRFLAKNWNYLIDPNVGSEEDQGLVSALLQKLFKREQLYTVFGTQRRYGLVRGDAVWHVLANPLKPAGSRISVKEVDPKNYFPIVDESDATKVIGVHLVDIITDPNDPEKKKQVARRQTYRKTEDGKITSSCLLFETDKWDDRNLAPKDIKMVGTVTPEFTLPPSITSLPVYLVRSSAVPGSLFGDSVLQGLERVFAGVNQTITDEELTLALQGLGMYWTDSGPPENADGSEGQWDFGPGQVVEVETDATFARVSGVGSVEPMLQHAKFLLDEAGSSVGVSDVATGRVQVNEAESGIALKLKLAPLLEANAEREVELLGKMDHFLYDIVQGWFVAYEGLPIGIPAEVMSNCDDPMPQNREAAIKEIIELAEAGLISLSEARTRLIALGYKLEGGEGNEASADLLIREQEALARAKNYDPFVNRFNAEMDGMSGQTPGTTTGGGTNGVIPAVVR